MSPVGWKDHTHVCADCEAIFACDGACEISRLCPGCAEYREAVETNEREAIKDMDASRDRRLAQGTPIGRSEQRAFDRYIHGDDDEPIRFR